MIQRNPDDPWILLDQKLRLRSLLIEDFRGFGRFEINNLGRVNLLVGTNNSGKTTVLEAINILSANGDFSSIWSTLRARGEDVFIDREDSNSSPGRQVDIRRLFRGHELEAGKTFKISSEGDSGIKTMTAKIEDSPSTDQQLLEAISRQIDSTEDILPPFSLSLKWGTGIGKEITLPLSNWGGFSIDMFRRASLRPNLVESIPVQMITTTSLTAEYVSSSFEKIVLTPKEDLVTEAMRIIEPDIERIASSGSDRNRYGSRLSYRGGILVRLKGVTDRIPIGSLGDGIWRMLGPALAVVQIENGILLVDEIDTGLHHTVMEQLWRFLYECAKRFNVQIFATTHSWDCCHSLAVICRDDVSEESDVTISRIERGRESAVGYTEREIVAVADRDIEVR